MCKTPHRAEIEARHAKGETLSSLAAFLQEQGTVISRQAIHHHMVNHLKFREQIADHYARTRAKLDEAVQEQVDGLLALDDTIQRNYRLLQETQAWLFDLVEKRERVPQSLVQMAASLSGELRQSLKIRKELTGKEDGRVEQIAKWIEQSIRQTTDEEVAEG